MSVIIHYNLPEIVEAFYRYNFDGSYPYKDPDFAREIFMTSRHTLDWREGNPVHDLCRRVEVLENLLRDIQDGRQDDEREAIRQTLNETSIAEHLAIDCDKLFHHVFQKP